VRKIYFVITAPEREKKIPNGIYAVLYASHQPHTVLKVGWMRSLDWSTSSSVVVLIL
jgi:hypothetical protein